MRIGLVTDSTAQLSEQETAALDQLTGDLFAIVPLTVLVDEVSFTDGELSATDLCESMTAGAQVSTAMAIPEQFATAYQGLVDQGAEAIIVVTMSGALSGTRDSAVSAASTQKVFVDVVDSRTTSAGLSGAVFVAARGIAEGFDAESVAGTVADWCAFETQTNFAPASLEFLRRGGRIGAASSLLGRALQIVPVLGLKSGEVVPVARVRTRSKALERMAILAASAADELKASNHEVGVEIQQAEGDVDHSDVVELSAKLAELGYQTSFRVLSTIITAHVGPGAIGITVQSTP